MLLLPLIAAAAANAAAANAAAAAAAAAAATEGHPRAAIMIPFRASLRPAAAMQVHLP